MLNTTYRLAKKHSACGRALDAWGRHVGGIEKFGFDTKIPLTDILEVLGLDDCIWALRATDNDDLAKIILVKFAIACADRVLIHYETKYPDDKRPRQAVEAAQAYLLNPSKESTYAAARAARAAYAAARAAYAAYAAAYAAARAAYAAADAAHAAYAAAYAADAARAAAYAAHAASDAADAAEREWQAAKLKELLNEI